MKKFTQKGFSLVELLVVLAISGVVSATIIGFFISQQRSHSAQEQVTFMQQNMRAGLGIMSRELRMAGYDPSRAGTMVFSNTGLSQITFRIDFNGNGVLETSPAETISYSFDAPNSQLDRNGQVLAEGIDGLAFAYAYDSDADGALDVDGSGNVIFAVAGPATTGGVGPLDGSVTWYQISDTGVATNTTTPALAADIRAVRIWLLAKTLAADPNYTNSNSYLVGSQTITPGDQQRRRLLDTAIRCRNMGL